MEENRIKIIRDDMGISQAKLADLTGIPLHRLKYAEADNARISKKIAQIIGEKLNYNSLWVLTGDGAMLAAENAFDIIPAGGANKSLESEFVNIPHFSDKISAGGGLIPVNDVDIKIAFRRDWIRRKGDASKMSLISVSGDSMAPTLMAGDLVLINHGQNQLDPQGGIYAIALGEVILIKRLQILYPSGKIRVTSDNAKYDSIDLPPDEVRINGRVIWFGREL
ncbi:MAG: XRE family transcriptional regulator [Deltaproteobacteria bacterium]|nr:XRE family transcriptional regulator [Deltaproteobacteria bacterium]